jgi:hypothetical protein
MIERVSKPNGLKLKKQTVWNLQEHRLERAIHTRKAKPCFANLWTWYYCDCFTCETDPEHHPGDQAPANVNANVLLNQNRLY